MARKKLTPNPDDETALESALESPEVDRDDDDGDEAPTRTRRRSMSSEDIGDKIARGISDGMARMVPKRVKPGSSSFDPRGAFRSFKGPRLKGDCYDNGIKLNFHEDQLYDEEINLLNGLTRSGRYIGRLVEVQVSDDAGVRVVMIRYPDKTIDQRMENKSRWRNFKELLQLITAEQNQLVTA